MFSFFRSVRNVLLSLTLFFFLVLVTIGVTGSSIGVFLSGNKNFPNDFQHISGGMRGIRSDEWLCWTPEAIGQVNHTPQFPIINKNLGPDGQNMLVIGMTSVPVKHVTALARPATWGYFFLPLRQALAWHWWFPLFACLISLTWMMLILIPSRLWLALCTSAFFCSSAYVAAWSFWPAYCVFFCALAFCLFIKLLEQGSFLKIIPISIALGITASGFALFLYPPWQIPLAYLFVGITVAHLYSEKLYKSVRVIHLIGLAVSALVCAIILFSFWMDAKEAIHAMMSTVYPGQRAAEHGGGLPLWRIFCGFLNLGTLYVDGAGVTNQSEISSFLLLYPVLIIHGIIMFFKRRIAVLDVVLILFLVFGFTYQFVGIPMWLANISQFSRVPSARLDLAMGLATMVLIAASFSYKIEARRIFKLNGWLSCAITLLISIALAGCLFWEPKPLLAQIPVSLTYLAFFGIFSITYAFFARKWVHFYAMVLVWNFATSLPFNPLSIAPSKVDISKGISESIKGGGARILVIGTQIEPMFFMASGHSVTNGVFYYPQSSIWASLDPKGEFKNITNRYQHLFFFLEPAAIKEGYRLKTPQPDVVQVYLSPASFDFTKVPADYILCPIEKHSLLSFSSYLRFIAADANWAIYQVIRNG